ncbi:MAG: hypothetical protein Q7R58_00585 [bacterium]|nr:hypothetical protein [bacterium]
MKSIIRTAVVLSLVFAPALAFAAIPQTSQTVFQPAIPASITTVQTNAGGTWGMFFSTGPGFGTCANSLCGIGSTILYIINSILVPVLFAIAFIVFLWGIYKAYIYSAGDPVEVEKGHKLVLWGLIAFAVMISIWGLVNVVANTFGLAGYGAIQPPRSY